MGMARGKKPAKKIGVPTGKSQYSGKASERTRGGGSPPAKKPSKGK